MAGRARETEDIDPEVDRFVRELEEDFSHDNLRGLSKSGLKRRRQYLHAEVRRFLQQAILSGHLRGEEIIYPESPSTGPLQRVAKAKQQCMDNIDTALRERKDEVGHRRFGRLFATWDRLNETLRTLR